MIGEKPHPAQAHVNMRVNLFNLPMLARLSLFDTSACLTQEEFTVKLKPYEKRLIEIADDACCGLAWLDRDLPKNILEERFISAQNLLIDIRSWMVKLMNGTLAEEDPTLAGWIDGLNRMIPTMKEGGCGEPH